MPQQPTRKYKECPINRRVYLTITREQKDDGKDNGALWDPDAQSWYYTSALAARRPQLAQYLYNTYFDQSHHDEIWRSYKLEPAPVAPPRIPTKAEISENVNGFIASMMADVPSAPTVQETTNGFQAAGKQQPAHPDEQQQRIEELERLLADVTHTVSGDAAITLLRGQAACQICKNNEYHVLMASDEAAKNDEMIAVAIMRAKESFGDTLELTGDEDFQRRAMAVMVKYNIKVVLPNKKQQQLYEEIKQEFVQKQAESENKEAVKDAMVEEAPADSLESAASIAPQKAGDTQPASRPPEEPKQEQPQQNFPRTGI